MRGRVLRKIFKGLAIVSGLFLFMLIFTFLPGYAYGDSDYVAVDSFVTYKTQGSSFKDEIEQVKDEKKSSQEGELNVDVSNLKFNPERFTPEEITSWTNVFKVASYFYSPKLTGHSGSGLTVLATAAAETSVDPTGKCPLVLVPESISKVNLTVTDEMLRNIGITDYVIDENSEISNLDAGDIGILQMSPSYFRFIDSSKVTGGEYAKLKAANKLELADKIGLLPNVQERLKRIAKGRATERTDRFNWYDACNMSARLYKDCLDSVKASGLVDINNAYQGVMLSAQNHNQPAIIDELSTVGKNHHNSKVRGFSNNSQFWDMYDQLQNDTIINNLKNILLKKFQDNPKRKTLFKDSWTSTLADWKAAGLKIPAGADESVPNTSYALQVVHFYIQYEMLYQGV